MLKRIDDLKVRPTRMTLQLANRFVKLLYGVVEDMLVRVGQFTFPVDFVVMDVEEDRKVTLILGKPFMKIAKMVIDMENSKMKIGT